MKKYLKLKLKQFLCEHMTTSIDKTITTRLVEKRWKYYEDGSREPLKNLEKILYMKIWSTCGKCGAKLILEHKD
jgi:hypothetical protein